MKIRNISATIVADAKRFSHQINTDEVFDTHSRLYRRQRRCGRRLCKSTGAGKMAKQFRARVSTDFEIVENGKTVGWIRVKPSGVLWSPKGKHSWHRVPIKKLQAMSLASDYKSWTSSSQVNGLSQC